MANPTYLSNLSYVNKDFQSIYVELLDLVKKLTYRWDPSISNESDPGVLLIKLMAICADKNNYTSDKNVLECFPESVTQEPNARQLFEQLGYTMHWYQAATSEISMKWVDDETIYAYKIPRFTMVSNDKNSIVYTIVDEREIMGDGSITTANVIQGVAETYTVNGEELITTANLDANNRLYFPDRNVAENGVFICNADSTTEGGRQENYDSWVRKTNLAVEPLGQYCYKFGVSNDGESCYIEFPDDIQSLMGEGLYITYIRTDGEDGNISAKVLEKFYNDVTITDPEDPESSLVLSADNVLITNLSSATNGYNPESIDSAYRNYKRTVGTFNTLVTLRDYANAIIESGMVSNAFVCDRTDDVQVSYNVLSTSNDVTHYVNCVETDSNDNPLMEAFDLKMFVLRNVDRPSTPDEYNSSFDVLVNDVSDTDPVIDNILSYINDLKSVQHDFQPILPNKIVMFRNKYTIDCKVIPQYRVTALQEEDIRGRIQRALYTQLNAKAIEFGEEITFAEVYDIIMAADERIKAITLGPLDYKTYAVYYNGVEFKEVPLGDLLIVGVGTYDESTEQIDVEDKINDALYYGTNTGSVYRYDQNTNKFVYDEAMNFSLDVYAKSILHGNTPLTEKVDDFILAYDQARANTDDPNPATDIDMVTTAVTIPFDSGSQPQATITLRENEVLQFYAPNLIDKLQYSNYVKFQFKFSAARNLPANTDYTLGADEALVLYWKDSDDDVDYNYYLYGGGTIVKASFPINTEAATSNFTGDSQGMTEGRGTTANIYYRYYEEGTLHETYLSTYISTKMNSSQYILTSSKTITIRDKNTLELDNKKYKCYWKLNTKTDGKYELFPQGSAGETQSYLLQNGEYFFYTNYDESMLAYWGEGTRIERICDASSSAMICEVVDISAFQSDGLKSFENYWVMLGSTYHLVGEETQFIALGEGTDITFRSVDAAPFTFSVNYGGINWGTGPADINAYTISYVTPSSSEPTVLPKMMIDGDGWNCRAVLNFVPTPDEPQKLLDNQSIVYHTANGFSGNITGNSNGVYVLADYAYHMDGGQNIDVTRMNANGDTLYAELYWYTSTVLDSPNITYMANGGAKLTFDHSGQDITINFKLPYDSTDDLYFIPLHNGNKNVDVLSVEMNGTSMEDLFGNTEFKKIGDYYLVATGADFVNLASLTVHIEYTGDGGKVVTLRPPYRVKVPDEMQGETFEALYRKVIDLDYKEVFDYTYQVPDEDLIENPLNPESFLNPKHICNPFTICQMDTSNMSILITNKIK